MQSVLTVDLLKSMSFNDFTNFCEERTCDGCWSMLDAIVCIDMLRTINDIKVKGLFKRKKTAEARETAWKELVEQFTEEDA